MKTYRFFSPLSKKDVYLTMKQLTNSKSELPSFIGNVNENGFSVMEYKLFSNNVLNPRIEAIVTENKSGTDIYIKASLNKCDKIGFFIFGIIICAIFTYFFSNAIKCNSLEYFLVGVTIFSFEMFCLALSSLFFTLKTRRIVKILKNELKNT